MITPLFIGSKCFIFSIHPFYIYFIPKCYVQNYYKKLTNEKSTLDEMLLNQRFKTNRIKISKIFQQKKHVESSKCFLLFTDTISCKLLPLKKILLYPFIQIISLTDLMR